MSDFVLNDSDTEVDSDEEVSTVIIIHINFCLFNSCLYFTTFRVLVARSLRQGFIETWSQ